MKRLIFFTILTGFLFLNVKGQTEVTLGTGSSVSGCDFRIFPQMSGDNYSSNRDDILTITSNDPTRSSVEVEIENLDIDATDTLYIYDGPDTNSTVLKKLNNSNYSAAGIFIYAATVQNSSGQLTLRFLSDGSGEGGGFSILTRCARPCQRVEVTLDTARSSHIPSLDPRLGDGYLYVNVCPYDTVRLTVRGIYPDNGHSYPQSDATSLFTWDYGDTVVSGVGLTSNVYKFREGRGYDVAITIEDSMGCMSSIPISFRVRTSSNPITSIAPFPDYCTEQHIDLRAGYDMYAQFRLDSVGSEQYSSLKVSDTIFLPDGVNCPPYGYMYRSPVTFTSFSPNARITQAGDLLFVRLNIEHSYIGDIRIELFCPDGKSTMILPDYQTTYRYSGSTGSDFGISYKPDGGGCNPAVNPPGVGWNYIWSENTSRGYQYAAGSSYVYENVNITGNSVDSSNTVQMSQIYKPWQSFSNLIGCPLNGTWYIEVQDTWGIDNGYIFGWEMALDERLLPQNWSYRVAMDSVYFTGPGANGESITPDEAGDIDYLFTLVDEYGCSYDTNFVIHTVQSPKPDLGEDLTLCTGEMILLESNFTDTTANYYWNTGSTTKDIYVVSQGEYIVEVTTYNADSSLVCRGSDTIMVKFLNTPDIDFAASQTSGCAPLQIRLTDHTLPADEGKSYEWFIYDGTGSTVFFSTQKDPEVTLERGGIYHVQLFVTTDVGCTDSLMKYNYLEVYPQPLTEFVAIPEMSLMSETGGEVYFHNYTDSLLLQTPGVYWHWDYGDGTEDSSAFSPTHTYGVWGDYDVTFYVTTEHGCSDQITHRIVIEDDLEFPNIITPNGDNINDVFAIKKLNTDINPDDPDGYRQNTLHIYDRWGKQVYKAENYDTYMKEEQLHIGRHYFDGANLPDGVYYFKFYYKGRVKTVNYHGSLTIIR